MTTQKKSQTPLLDSLKRKNEKKPYIVTLTQAESESGKSLPTILAARRAKGERIPSKFELRGVPGGMMTVKSGFMIR